MNKTALLFDRELINRFAGQLLDVAEHHVALAKKRNEYRAFPGTYGYELRQLYIESASIALEIASVLLGTEGL